MSPVPAIAAPLRRRRVERRLRRFIVGELLERPFDGEDPLAAGEVDSLGQEQLATFIGEVYGLQLSDADMAAENFKDIRTLAAFVEARR
jgi:acyl carrier protein